MAKDQMELDVENTDTFDGDEMNLNDLDGQWIKNPKVGESVEFTAKRFVKNKNTKAKDRNGKEFDKSLSKVDYAIEVHTEDGSIYTVSAWEVWGKIKSIAKKLKLISGVKYRVKHLKDGMKEKGGDSYDVLVEINGKWNRLDRKSNEFQVV